MKNDEILILRWRQEAEARLSWGESKDWGDYDFERLSELIFEKTKTRLSLSTLKRIWGKVRYESKPNIATLNCMARFLDYTDWRAFRNKETGVADEDRFPHTEEFKTEPIPQDVSGKSTLQEKRKLPGKWSAPIAALIVLVALVLIVLSVKESFIKRTEKQSFFFKSHTVSEYLPNSVVFDYRISGIHSDSVFIQQSWDEKRRERIPVDGRQHTSIYYYPGYFNAKLLVDGKVRKDDAVFIPTNGWLGIIEKSPVPIYLGKKEIRLEKGMGVGAGLLSQKTGSTVFNDRWVHFFNVKDFGEVDGRDFNLQAIFRNTSLPEESICRKIRIIVIGSDNAIIIPLGNTGCSSDFYLFDGDEWINGKERDLSAFGFRSSGLQKLTCSISQGLFKISLNDKVIFSSKVKYSIGKIKGVCLSFEGSAEIREIELANSSSLIYKDDFSSF